MITFQQFKRELEKDIIGLDNILIRNKEERKLVEDFLIAQRYEILKPISISAEDYKHNYVYLTLNKGFSLYHLDVCYEGRRNTIELICHKNLV